MLVLQADVLAMHGMQEGLQFVLAPASSLPERCCSPADLIQAQRRGPRGGFALRLFSLERDRSAGLSDLPWDGSLPFDQSATPSGRRMICDALVPYFNPEHNWLAVYQADPDRSGSLLCLDRCALSQLSNEVCWFYPTHDGTYLSWERELQLQLGVGCVAATADPEPAAPFQRQEMAVLWSLLGDDSALTCVGLTYRGQRIEWPLTSQAPEPMATWSRFCVDGQAPVTLVVEDCQPVFGPSAVPS